MAVSKLDYIYSAFILHSDEVAVMENKTNDLIKAADVNVERFWPGLFAKTLSNVNFANLICNVGVGGLAPAAGGAAPAPASTAALGEVKKKEEAKKEESEESDHDMGFGLFD